MGKLMQAGSTCRNTYGSSDKVWIIFVKISHIKFNHNPFIGSHVVAHVYTHTGSNFNTCCEQT